MRPESPTHDPRRLIAAGILQGLGAVIPTLVFASFVYNGDAETWRAAFWAAGPLALLLAIPLARGNARARRISLILCFLYPVGPILDLCFLKGSLHGGEVYLFGFAVMGFVGGAVVWVVVQWDAIKSGR